MVPLGTRRRQLALLIKMPTGWITRADLKDRIEAVVSRLQNETAQRVVRDVYLTTADGTVAERRRAVARRLSMPLSALDALCECTINVLRQLVKEQVAASCPDGT